MGESVDLLADELRAKALEELLRVRTSRLREQDLASQLRQQLRELLGIARFVEEVGAEHEIPGRRAKQRLGLAPADACDAEEDAVALGVPAQQVNRVLRPVGREDLGAGDCCGERRQSETAAELENPQPVQLPCRDVAGEREAARPQLGPVGQELLLVEGRLVDQLLGARRPEDRQAPTERKLNFRFDEVQSGANRSTGTPSGSLSCAYRWPQNASHGSFSPSKPAATTRA